MLTPAAVKAAQPMARAYKLFDAGGLFLFVAPSGLRSWRYKCQRDGRERLITLGRYPAMSLPEARAARDEARRALCEHGRVVPKAAKNLSSFAQLARAWHAHQAPRWSAVHAADVLASLERDALPELGELPIGMIAAPELLDLLERVEGRGCLPTAKRLRQRISAIFRWAIARKLCEADPAAILSQAMLPARPARQHPALLTAEACRQLLDDCETTPARPLVRLASRFLALTAVRLDAVRGMRWGEILLDSPDGPIWRVPAARMKLAKVKKTDERFDHIVPLSAQALQVLHEVVVLVRGRADAVLHADQLVFARGAAPMGEGAIRQLYIDAGYRGRHVPHGWRASWSTILNKLRPDQRAAIDLALGHTPKDKVEAAYNRDDQLAQRRVLMDRWGALIG